MCRLRDLLQPRLHSEQQAVLPEFLQSLVGDQWQPWEGPVPGVLPLALYLRLRLGEYITSTHCTWGWLAVQWRGKERTWTLGRLAGVEEWFWLEQEGDRMYPGIQRFLGRQVATCKWLPGGRSDFCVRLSLTISPSRALSHLSVPSCKCPSLWGLTHS